MAYTTSRTPSWSGHVSKVNIFTIGHSTHSWEHFFQLLHDAGITAIADVRSSPFSRHTPQFSQAQLKERLKEADLTYVFLGKELGGRPSDASLYSEGTADYEKMAKTTNFLNGLLRLEKGARDYKIAMMCSEHDPLDCHRCLLVGRQLVARRIHVEHILSNGEISPHSQIENRLLDLEKRDHSDLFASRNELLAYAYHERGRKVAYAEQLPAPQENFSAD